MVHEWIYAISSVMVVSLISLIGVITMAVKKSKLNKILLFMVSFSAGSLFGGAFIHLIPKAAKELGVGLALSLYILLGIILFFILEKFIHWRHCHIPTSKGHPHPFGMMNLIGDGFHNLIDGMIIAAAYLAAVPIGIATTFAVMLHEIPQEIGDFGVLVHAGYSKTKALVFNFLSGLSALLGAVIVLSLGTKVQGLTIALIPITAGGFIYIAGSDLIPELKKDSDSVKKNFQQFAWLLLGIGMMVLLTLFE
ncbi:ZIP family metal transporter [Candidatus Woesearchaeota archaeon]|nr:ZIP family metal transporter [Candidatus Woesearchaeota archaeon]